MTGNDEDDNISDGHTVGIDEKAFEKTWEENKLPILTNKMQFRRHIEAYEASRVPSKDANKNNGLTCANDVKTASCAPASDQPVDNSVDWEEALESLVKSHRDGELSEWEIHLLGRRFKAALLNKREISYREYSDKVARMARLIQVTLVLPDDETPTGLGSACYDIATESSESWEGRQK